MDHHTRMPDLMILEHKLDVERLPYGMIKIHTSMTSHVRDRYIAYTCIVTSLLKRGLT